MSQSIIVGEASSTISPLRRLLSFSLTLAASLGTFGFFAIQGVVLARMLGLEMRGVFAATIVFPQALLYLGLLGAPELFAGYAAQGLPNAALRRSAALYGLVAGLLSMAICIILDLIFIPAEFRSALPLAILCAATMPLQQIRLAVQAVDHGQRELTRYNQVRLLAAAVFPLLLLIAMLMGYRNITVACSMFVAAQVATLGLINLGMNESWIGPTAIPLRQALHEAKGLMAAWFSTELLERLDAVLMMVLVADKAILGSYSTAIPIAAMMIIVPNAVGLYAFNRGARNDERITSRDAWSFLAFGVIIQTLCAMAFACLLPYLVQFFYGSEFQPAVQFAWLLLPAGVFRGLLQACDSYLRARKKPGVGVRARAWTIPILLVVSFAGSSYLGPNAIPIGLGIAQFICFLIVAYAVIEDSRELAVESPA